MKAPMIGCLVAAGMILMPAARAADDPTADENDAMPGIEEAIPAPVSALAAPALRPFPGGVRMAVSTTSELAQRHVLQGLDHMHGGWDFEASRHFAAAMTEDPDCLLAHWGMIMCLLNPSPETGAARNAASDRLLDLLDRGKGSELERGYAYGLVKYMEEGPAGAALAFRKVAERFPNEIQAAVFSALFNRGGYDEFGSAKPDQEDAERSLLALIEKNPDSVVPLNALLTIRAEAHDVTDSLDLVRSLARMIPDYPPFFHLLGHYEWRAGNHAAAAAAFGKATGFYQNWMRENGAGLADCPEWVRSESYRIVALLSRGDFDIAYAAARQLAATPLPAGRPASAGSRMLLWEATGLPARILLHRGLRGNSREATASLPAAAELRPLHPHSLAYWWIDGLRLALEARSLLDEDKPEQAREVIDALSHHGESMAAMQTAAANGGERSAWIRAFRGLEVLASELRGRLFLAGPEARRPLAYNWLASATDRQAPASMLMPPLVLTPMAARLGDFQLASGKPKEAVEAYQRALAAFPNEVTALEGLRDAFQAAGDKAAAAATAARIKALTGE